MFDYINLQEALLLQRDRATLLLVQILLTHNSGIYRA